MGTSAKLTCPFFSTHRAVRAQLSRVMRGLCCEHCPDGALERRYVGQGREHCSWFTEVVGRVGDSNPHATGHLSTRTRFRRRESHTTV